MNFVIPMAGEGRRFVDAGYKIPKYLINAKGKTLLQWSIDSLPLQLATKLIFVILKQHQEDYNVVEAISTFYRNKVRSLEFVFLDGPTRGQAETVYLTQNHIIEHEPLLIFNIDTYFRSDLLKEKLLSKQVSDGILGCFNSNENRFSFAAVDGNGIVMQTAEKNVISNFALTGLYHFSNANDFFETAKHHLDNNIRYKNEFYIAPMYNFLIKKGKKFTLDLVNEFQILGTPEELGEFINK